MHCKVKSSISPLVRETCLFPAGSDCRAYCHRLISLEDSEDVIDFTKLSSYLSQAISSSPSASPLISSNPASLLSFVYSL
jgi:hypothetical protein